jgi:hypothetical protein
MKKERKEEERKKERGKNDVSCIAIERHTLLSAKKKKKKHT